MKNRKIIITGATGFIGERVIANLVKKYRSTDIICLVSNKKNKLEIKRTKKLVKYNLKIIKVDLTNEGSLKNPPKNPDVVIHLAANTETSESDHKVNNIGTKNLIKALSPIPPNTHFIYMGTTAIMSGRKNCSKPFNEHDLPSPTNEYSRTKLKAENILIDESRIQKFKLTIFRLPTVYGKGMRKNSFFDFLKKLILKNSFFTKLNWPGKTSFVHVDDVAKSIVAIINKPPSKNKFQLFILQTESFTLAQISKMLHKELGIKYKPIRLPHFFWKIIASTRLYIYKLEVVLPPKLYNYVWRASLVIDNVIYSKSNKIKKLLSPRRQKMLKDCISEVV